MLSIPIDVLSAPTNSHISDGLRRIRLVRDIERTDVKRRRTRQRQQQSKRDKNDDERRNPTV
jgi:hypothetical protein